jgi:signal transduction histidine kinase
MGSSSPPASRAVARRPLDGDDPVLLGVAATLARRFDLDPVAVRLACVIMAVAGGWGVGLYLVGWVFLVWRAELPCRPSPSWAADGSRTLGVAVVVLGALLVLRALALGFADTLVWPVAVVGTGVMLGWRHLNPAVSAVPDDPRHPQRRGASTDLARLAGGFFLVVGGFTSLLAANLPVGSVRDGLIAVVVVAAGVLLILGPWAMGLTQSLAQERRERIRADERAEVATHLHDSVLQTLTLLQKRSNEPEVMAALARHQERELRRWLYGSESRAGGAHRFRQALEAMVSDVEDQHLVQVDNVTVGDGPVDASLQAVVSAAREALVNAAKFSGLRTASLYAELRDAHVEVYVRDRGVGFSPEHVGPDRKGISDSIVGRMERLGGTAQIRSAPGAGTEVRLRLESSTTRRSNGHSGRNGA